MTTSPGQDNPLVNPLEADWPPQTMDAEGTTHPDAVNQEYDLQGRGHVKPGEGEAYTGPKGPTGATGASGPTQ